METTSLQRLDSFPYRHRVASVMTRPLVTAVTDEPIATVAERLIQEAVSSVVVLDGLGRPAGIATERDLLRSFAGPSRDTASVVKDVMSSPVATVEEGTFLYVAIGRMARLGFRHLVVVDADGAAIGMVTVRALLALRSAGTVQLGDRIAVAETVADLAAARAELPSLSRRLLAEGVSAGDVAAVISGVYIDLTARVAALVEAEMIEDAAFGSAPAPWCLLMLGSGGRGESMLAPDQDNAILHAGGTGDDPWFAEAGRRIADRLDAVGIPYCKGGVMAMNAVWRGSVQEWQDRLRGWTRTSDPDALLAVDIFYDFVPAYGVASLATDLRAFSTQVASRAPEFLRRLGFALEGHKPPLGLFGRFRRQDGRVDLKLGGLLPLVAGARLLALRRGIAATGTVDRLAAMDLTGAAADERIALGEAREILMCAVLEQQLEDIDRGAAPSSRVDPTRWSRRRVGTVKEALRTVSRLRLLVMDALSASGSLPPRN